VTPQSKLSELIDADALGADVDKAFGVERSIDDVVERHLDNKLQLTLPHGGRDVPPDEDDPSVRDGVTLSRVQFMDDADLPEVSDSKVRSLDDLMARFPFDGTGTYYIRVMRKKPTTWGGYQCSGILRPIIVNIDQQEFIEQYGGGEYSLIVYGPPRRGGIMDPQTGKIKPRALTDDVTFTVPYDASGVYGVAPNPEAALVVDEIGEAMEGNQTPGIPRQFMRRPATPSDASMYKATMENDRIREDKQENASAMAARAHADVERVRIEKDAGIQERALDILTEQVRVAQKSNSGTDVGAIIRSISEVMKAQGPRDNSEQVAQMLDNARKESERLMQSHKEELRRIMESQTADRERATEIHRQDSERMQKAHEIEIAALRREVKLEQERGEKLLTQAEDRSHREIESLKNEQARILESIKGEHARAIDIAQRDSERRVADTERVLRMQIDSEAKAHERELNGIRTSFDGKLHTDKSILEDRMRVANEEIARLRDENRRLQDELKEKGNLPDQIQKFTDTAAALGFGKVDGAPEGEAPKRWQDTVGDLAKEVVPRLPEILRGAGDMLQQRAQAKQILQTQQPNQAPPMMAMPQMAPMHQMPPMPFATEDSSLPRMHQGSAPLPITASMYPPNMQMPPQQPPQAQMPPQQMSMPAPQNMAIIETPQQPPQAPPPTEQPQHTPQQEASEDTIEDSQIMMFRGALEQAIAEKHKPVAFVKQLVEQYGVDMVKQISATLKYDRVMLALRRSPEAAGSVLLTFKGKSWLREALKLAGEVQ
jgi:hypothetical protein